MGVIPKRGRESAPKIRQSTFQNVDHFEKCSQIQMIEIRGDLKKISIFKDIAQIGGGRSTSCQKIEKK